jgi:hypothetical protein
MKKLSEKGKKFLLNLAKFFKFSIDFYKIKVYNKFVVVKSGVLWVKKPRKGVRTDADR